MIRDAKALSLFDSSDFPSSAADDDSGARSSNVVALGKNALDSSSGTNTNGSANTATREAVIGTLIWYSVSDAVRLTPEALREAMDSASLDTATLTPRAPTPESALTRACEAAQVRMKRLSQDRGGAQIHEERYANVLVRPASFARGVKQMVTEVLDCSRNRLVYEPFATLSLEEGVLEVELLQASPGGMLGVESDAIANLRTYFEYEKSRHDGEGVRRVIGRALSAANAITLRNSGGMYFVPKNPKDSEKEAAHSAAARNLLTFVEEVRKRAESAPTRTPRPSRAMSVPLVDREEYREIVAESLEEHVEKEAKALVSEMSRLLKSEQAVTPRRGRGFVERVNSLREGVTQYEELLEMRATEARTHLDTAMKQARGLLGRVEAPDDAGDSL